MPQSQSPEIECGSLIHFPPASCSRPQGHAGDHMTAEIPPQLSGVAAKMVTASDELDAERVQLSAEREAQYRAFRHRYRRLQVAFWAAILSTISIAFCGIVAMLPWR